MKIGPLIIQGDDEVLDAIPADALRGPAREFGFLLPFRTSSDKRSTFSIVSEVERAATHRATCPPTFSAQVVPMNSIPRAGVDMMT